jgi:hypothetical protein
MKPHRLPYWLLILILLLLSATFLTGTLQAFASNPSTLPTATPQSTLAPSQTPEAGSTPVPAYAVGNTDGIISLALVVIGIMLIGAVWGLRQPRPSPRADRNP